MFGWLRRLLGSRQPALPQKPAVQIGPGRAFWFDIVGESNYQGTLRRIDGGRLAREEEVVLPALVIPEPQNAYDPNALAVHAEGYGKIGYFDRDSAGYTFAALGKMLRNQGLVGACEARLTGGWQSDVSIGVRLSILPPEAFGTSGIQPVSEPREQRPRGLACDSPGWETRPRVALPPSNGKSLALTQEHLCQDELLRLCDGQDPAQVTCVFYAVVVPTEAGPIVCAEGGAPVGRLSKTDTERYRAVISELTAAGAVGSTDGWIIPEREGLGVRLSVATPAALLAHWKALPS